MGRKINLQLLDDDGNVILETEAVEEAKNKEKAIKITQTTEYIKRMLFELGIETDNFSIQGRGDKIISYSIEIPEKGNKKAINALLDKGWKKERRANHISHDPFGNSIKQYKNYEMIAVMRYYVE